MKKSKPIKPPADLAGDALAEWNRIVAAAADVGRRYSERDAIALTNCCRAIVLCHELYGMVRAEGVVLKFSNGVVGVNPTYKAWVQASAMLRGLLNDLGLTPASRKFDRDKGDAEALKPLKF